MYPSTTIEIDDQSTIASLEIADVQNKPVFMMAITSDKGSEDFKYINGSSFFTQYGDISFAKHGQPLLQAANAINAGAKLYVKRVVAPDSKLANIGIIGHVKSTSVQKTNSSGELLYTEDGTGDETTVSSGNTALMTTTCTISYTAVTTDASTNSLADLADMFNTTNGVEEHAYPLFVIADIGRGVSNKKFKLTPDYNISRTASTVKYLLQVLENNESVDTIVTTMHPDIIEDSKNIFITAVVAASTNQQIRCMGFDDNVFAFIKDIAETSGIDESTLQYCDFMFGRTKKGAVLDNIIVEGGIALDNIFGIPLAGGSNGSFADSPITAAAYTAEMVKVFNGTSSDEIYNVDNTPIDAVIDANYPDDVKRAIESLVAFREDISYFRDMGTLVKSIAEMEIGNMLNAKNRYCHTYHNSYDIIDPYTKKQVKVTIGYSIARLLVSHFVNGRTRPFAGQIHGVTIPEAIDGTINFVPKVTPSANQKTELEDLRINYASYFDGVLTLETEYSSQDAHTQLSYLNNVLGVQEIIKAVKKRCPKIRYSFIDGSDLAKYQEDVQTELNKYSANYKSLTMAYVEDSLYSSNKIYYAVIKVSFRNFVQSEIFKLIALPS